VVELAVGAHEAESGPDEGPLRSDVVQSCVGDNPGQSVVGGDGQQGDDRLCGPDGCGPRPPPRCFVRNAILLCALRRPSSRRQLLLRPNGLFNRRSGNTGDGATG